MEGSDEDAARIDAANVGEAMRRGVYRYRVDGLERRGIRAGFSRSFSTGPGAVPVNESVRQKRGVEVVAYD